MKPKGNRPLGIPRCRWDNIIKWIFKKWNGGGGMEWIDLTQDRVRWWALVHAVTSLHIL